MIPALVIRNLTKTYKNGFTALKGIDLDVNQGDFFALLGPNGAGKSTTIGIIASLVTKTAGKVAVFGADIDREFDRAKSYLGLVPQEINLNIFEPLLPILINQAGYYGIPRQQAREREAQLHGLAEDHAPRGFEHALGRRVRRGLELTLEQHARIVLDGLRDLALRRGAFG